MSINLFHQSLDRETNWNNAIFCPFPPENERIANTILRLIDNNIIENKYFFHLDKVFQKFENVTEQGVRYLEDNSEKNNFLKLFHKLNFVFFHCNQRDFSNIKSSFFIESILLSLIPIVHKSTWMAAELEKYALDILIVDFNYVDLKERINLINKNKLIIGLKLKVMKNSFLEFFNINTKSTSPILPDAAILNQIRTVHVFGQMQPKQSGSKLLRSSPLYSTEVIFPKSIKCLGLELKHSNEKHARNLLHLLWLTIIALKKIKNNSNDLFVVWQGYGSYAIWISYLVGIKPLFILNTYKIPESLNQSVWKVINDKILKKLIAKSEAIITISRTQAVRLNLFNCKKAAWIPFASDSDWWTPKMPDYEFLGNHGINYRNFILVMGDVDRDEKITLRALRNLNYPILRVTRDKGTARTALKAFTDENVKHGKVCLNVSYELLRELYRGAKFVVVPAKTELHPAGMTSLTEAMCCGKPVIIPSGLATDGYIYDGYNAFVLDQWEEGRINIIAKNICSTDIGMYIGNNARHTVDELINFNASVSRLNEFLTNY